MQNMTRIESDIRYVMSSKLIAQEMLTILRKGQSVEEAFEIIHDKKEYYE
jgi:hypothetical protein